MSSKTFVNVFLSSIVDDCKCLQEKFEHVSIKHIYKEANACVDLLTKADCAQLSDFISFCTPQAHVLDALSFERAHVLEALS